MKSKAKLNIREKGITLIALILTVLLLIILAAVVIKGITGEEGILKYTTEIAYEYGKAQQIEQLEQLVHSIILKDSILRKTYNIR